MIAVDKNSDKTLITKFENENSWCYKLENGTCIVKNGEIEDYDERTIDLIIKVNHDCVDNKLNNPSSGHSYLIYDNCVEMLSLSHDPKDKRQQANKLIKAINELFKTNCSANDFEQCYYPSVFVSNKKNKKIEVLFLTCSINISKTPIENNTLLNTTQIDLNKLEDLTYENLMREINK